MLIFTTIVTLIEFFCMRELHRMHIKTKQDEDNTGWDDLSSSYYTERKEERNAI